MPILDLEINNIQNEPSFSLEPLPEALDNNIHIRKPFLHLTSHVERRGIFVSCSIAVKLSLVPVEVLSLITLHGELRISMTDMSKLSTIPDETNQCHLIDARFDPTTHTE